MLNRVFDWIIGRQPVQTATGLAALITAGFGLAKAFGVLDSITPEQVAAIAAFVTVTAGWLGHRAVSPVTGQTERQINRLKKELAAEDGGIFAAICIGFAVVFLILFAFCVTVGNSDDDERGLGAPTWVADHDDEGRRGDKDGEEGESGEEGGRPSDEDPGNRCAAFVVIACGDLVVPIPEAPGGGGRT